MPNTRDLTDFAFAEPFQPFRIQTTSGRVLEIRYEWEVQVGRSDFMVHTPPENDPDAPPRWEIIRLDLIESMESLHPTAPTTVFVVQHLHVHENGEECVKMIGVYESRRAAEQAVRRLATQPGFRDHRNIVDPLRDDEKSGFYIDAYRVGEDHWTEGYETGR
jgi:hypothetical protein